MLSCRAGFAWLPQYGVFRFNFFSFLAGWTPRLSINTGPRTTGNTS